MLNRVVILAVFGIIFIARTVCPAHASEPAAGTTVLEETSLWRFHVALRKPVAPDAANRVIKIHVSYRDYPGLEQLETAAPPDDWTSAEFDDSVWPQGKAMPSVRGEGSIAQVLEAPGVQFSTGLLSLRGKFNVTDPAAVTGLQLRLKYRGGVVVYLNGREIARQDLPEGKLDARTPGRIYPSDAYLDSAGRLIPEDYHLHRRIAEGEKDLADRVTKRDRLLGPLRVPTDALKAGLNVLAVEIHRSDYHPIALTDDFSAKSGWTPAGLFALRLAASGSGVTPNAARPAGFRVWNYDVNDRVTAADQADPTEPLRPVRIAGAKNGSFSGQVVVGDTAPIAALKAVASDLRTDAGAVIPASAILLRGGRFDGRAYGVPDWCDGLLPSVPADVPLHKSSGAALLPVWITVRVPGDAAPGEYRAALTISAQGRKDVAVPLVLTVADWTLPDPRDFRTYVGIYQSPTTLSIRYKVPEWSDQHWKLVDKSYALLAQLGNKIAILPVVDRTQFGNDEGLVYWVRKDDGSYDYDFSVFDRFVELVKRRLGNLDFLALQIWHSGGWETRKADQENTVTVIDKKTGKREHMQVPAFGTDASKRFWKPVLDPIRTRLAKAGLDKAMTIGILSDGTAPPEVFRMFDELVPGGANWMRGCHQGTRSAEPYCLVKGNVGRVVCHEYCYGMSMADPARGLPPIWKQRNSPGVAFIRHNFDHTLSLLKYRTFPERSLYCGTRGVGRTGLDFWSVISARDNANSIFNRYPQSSCAQRAPNMYALTWPGPDGAEPTARFQQFLEGVQSAEATILVAQAQGERSAALGSELAAKCRQLLLDRLNYARSHCPEAYGEIYFRTNHLGWLDLDARTYAAAAEITARLKASR